MQEQRNGGTRLKMYLKFKKFLVILLLIFILILISAFLILYKMQKDTHTLVVNKINLSYSDLPNDLENYKIGFVSDTHIGLSTNLKFFDSIIKTLNSLDLDILLLGGDYIWMKESALFQYPRNSLFNGIEFKLNAEKIYFYNIEKFSSVKTKDGIYAVYGNHDNWIFPNLLKKISKHKESKIKLKGESFNYIKKGDSNLSIFTFQDFWKKIPNVENHNFKLKKNEFRILIAHNPDTISYINKYIPLEYNLSLSGHTHAGQIRIPFIPKASNTYYKEYVLGLSKIKKNSYHYTSSGIGCTSVPFRFNTKPEIAVFTLVKNK